MDLRPLVKLELSRGHWLLYRLHLFTQLFTFEMPHASLTERLLAIFFFYLFWFNGIFYLLKGAHLVRHVGYRIAKNIVTTQLQKINQFL